MDFSNRASLTEASANLVLSSPHRVVRGDQTAESALTASIIPEFGIRWPAEVIRRVGPANVAGSRYLNNLHLLRRNPTLKLADYNRVSQLWPNASFNDPTSFPDSWGNGGKSSSVSTLTTPTPSGNGHRSYSGSLTWVFWARNSLLPCPGRSSPTCRTSRNLLTFPLRFGARKCPPVPRPHRSSQRVTLSVRIGGIFTSLDSGRRPVNFGCWPARRFGVSSTERGPVLLFFSPVSEDEASPIEIRFAEDDEYLLQSAVPIGCAYRRAEGFPHLLIRARSYFAFCELIDVRPFPVQGRIIIQWSSVFRAGLTFANYVSYVKKVCFSPMKLCHGAPRLSGMSPKLWSFLESPISGNPPPATLSAFPM